MKERFYHYDAGYNMPENVNDAVYEGYVRTVAASSLPLCLSLRPTPSLAKPRMIRTTTSQFIAISAIAGAKQTVHMALPRKHNRIATMSVNCRVVFLGQEATFLWKLWAIKCSTKYDHGATDMRRWEGDSMQYLGLWTHGPLKQGPEGLGDLWSDLTERET